ncbi:hypothetical protein TRVL_08469 [Trypanosoma vivax]|nr:hypothetical protein TRVL_08469 [Trypanosoma vivax]
MRRVVSGDTVLQRADTRRWWRPASSTRATCHASRVSLPQGSESTSRSQCCTEIVIVCHISGYLAAVLACAASVCGHIRVAPCHFRTCALLLACHHGMLNASPEAPQHQAPRTAADTRRMKRGVCMFARVDGCA